MSFDPDRLLGRLRSLYTQPRPAPRTSVAPRHAPRLSAAPRPDPRLSARAYLFKPLCDQILSQGGGNLRFPTSREIQDHLIPMLEAFTITTWAVNFADAILTVKLAFRHESDPSVREDEFVNMLQLWGDVLSYASPNRAKVQWLVRFNDGITTSTPMTWALRGSQMDTDAIVQLLHSESGAYDTADAALNDVDGAPTFELKCVFIPPSDQDGGGGGQKRKIPEWVLHPKRFHKLVGWKPHEYGQAGKEVYVYEPKRGQAAWTTAKKLKLGRPEGPRKHVVYKDCKTTDGLQDCAARALAFLFVRQYGGEDPVKKDNRFDYAGASVSMKQPGNYYNNVGPKTYIAKSAKKLLEYAGVDDAHPVDYRQMDMFTTENALGLNARIYVFGPTRNGVPELLYKTPDHRADERLAADPVLRREQHEAEIRRFNYKSLFDIREAFNERPTQYYCLWLSGRHYHAVETCDVHKLWPSNAMVSQRFVSFCFKHDKPHTEEVAVECSDKAVKGAALCEACGTTKCDAAAYSDQPPPVEQEEEEEEDKKDQGVVPADEVQNPPGKPKRYCNECNLTFKSQLCFQLHLKPRPATVGKKKLMDAIQCDLRYRCRFCCTLMLGHAKWDKPVHTRRCVRTATSLLNLHSCGHCRTKYASKEDFDQHDCILKAPTKRVKEQKARRLPNVWYVDFETYLAPAESAEGVMSLHEAKDVHVVNLVVMTSADDPDIEYVFDNIKDFIDHVFDDDYFDNRGAGEGGEFAKSTTLIAHNGRGYDWPTLLAAVHKFSRRLSYTNVTQGTKLMYVLFDNMPKGSAPYVGAVNVDEAEAAENVKTPIISKYDDQGRPLFSEVRLIDSLSFIPRALADFSGMFGLGEEKLKGFWPYKFNKPENFSYKGPIPDIERYEPLSMSEKKFKSFWTWYAEQIYETNKVEDVEDHLFRAMRWVEMNTTGEQHGKQRVFFAKWAEDWAKRQQKPEYVGDWDFAKMLYEYCRQDVRILRAGFEWFRMYCMTLFPDDTVRGFDPARFVSVTGMCLEIWLSKWYTVNTFTPLPYDLSERLRKAFHGGRTEAAVLYFNLEAFTRYDRPAHFPGGRRLSKYAECRVKDLRSSYPYQCRERPYPTGDPIIFQSAEQFVQYFAGVPGARAAQWPGDQNDGETISRILADMTATAEHDGWQKVFDTEVLDLFLSHSPTSLAIIELTFEGPEGMRFPVLPSNVVVEEKPEKGPIKRTTKLLFDLFEHKDQCKTTVSLQRAKSAGYMFKDVRMITYWPKEQCKVGLWKEYVDLFYGQKLAAEGWPAGCETDAQKAAHLRYLKAVHNLDIKKEQVQKNAGLYSMSKTMVTSNWGRLVMGSNKPNVTVFRAPEQLEDFFTLLKDPRLIIHDVITLNKDTAKVRWSKAEGYERLAPKTNVVVGIFTTEWGRESLYSGIEQLHPDQVIYMDTDSLYYVVDSTQNDWGDIKEGDAIGSWSDDLNKIGTTPEDVRFINETWAGSAKNYGYTTVKKIDGSGLEKKVKVKGYNLSGGWLDGTSSQNLLSYDRCKQRVIDGYKDLVMHGLDRPAQDPQQLEVTRFLTAPTYDKVTVKAKQTYRFRYDKRTISRELSVLDPVTGEPVMIQTVPYGYMKTYDAAGKAIVDYSPLVV